MGTAVTTCNMSDSTKVKNYEKKEKSQLWNKSSNFSLSNNEGEKEDKKNWKKNDNSAKNDSTLSLHIEGYENLVEANLFGDKIDETLKNYDSIKNGKNTKQIIFPDLAMIIQNPFEFSRQKNNHVSEPEVSKFKASQRLINPRQSNDQRSNDEVAATPNKASNDRSQRRVHFPEELPRHNPVNGMRPRGRKRKQMLKKGEKSTKKTAKSVRSAKPRNYSLPAKKKKFDKLFQSMKPKRPSKKAKIEEPCKYQWWKDEELKNSALKIYVDTEEQPKENHPLLKIPPITDDFEVPIENCKRLFRKNPAYHEVLTSMYSLDDSDRKFCEIENINKFQLKRFFTHGSRSVHDFFFRPNQLFMVGIDCETFSKLFKRYENVLESFAEKNSFKSLELIPHHDQIPHMSEEVIPETQMSDEETPEYMCFAPPKQKTPVRNKDKLFRSSYAAALKMSHEAHLFHAHAVDLVASATEDLNFAQKVSEQHKLRFDDDVICLGTLDPPDDGCVNDKDVDDIECKLSAINALADVLADIDADSDSDLDLNSDNEFMEAPKASDDLVKLIKEQAATINAFAIPGLSAIRSAKLSPECQAKVEAKAPFSLTEGRPKRVRKANSRYQD